MLGKASNEAHLLWGARGISGMAEDPEHDKERDLAAMTLLRTKPKYAAEPCDNNKTSEENHVTVVAAVHDAAVPGA